MSQGGIGKTVTAAWLARHDDIRRHFGFIIWVTLGQTPDLDDMRALIHLQLTGEELASDATPEQAKEKITVAMRGRTVLVILDDIWEEEHSSALDFIDTATASKTLVTTRIRGLGGASQVELGVPSPEESVKLLLASAGLAHLSPVPAEAAEVVQICGCLPLAVDLAGNMLRDLGVGGSDWAGVPKLLREEMRASADSDETTVEYRVIAASLSAIPKRDREQTQKVFRVFALVAEDTHVPLSVFRILLSAVTGESELVGELQLRKWIQVLINRSIVLGTWERPQLHDIVREYAIQLFSPEELQRLQAAAVDAFRAHRPPSPDPTHKGLGFHAWNVEKAPNDACARYVKLELHHHVREAVGTDADLSARGPIAAWMKDYPFDDMPVQVGRGLGLERLEQFFAQVAKAGTDHVLMFAAGVAVFLVRVHTESMVAAFAAAPSNLVRAYHEGFNKAHERPAGWSQTQWEHYRLDTRKQITGIWQTYSLLTPEELADNLARLKELVRSTELGRARREFGEAVLWETEGKPLFQAGDVEAGDPLLLKYWQKAIEQDANRVQGLVYVGFEFSGAVGFSLRCLLRLPGWRWDVFGEDCTAQLTLPVKRYETGQGLRPVLPSHFFTALRGNIGAYNEVMDMWCEKAYAMLADPAAETMLSPDDAQVPEAFEFQIPLLPLMGRGAEAAQLLEAFGLTWSTTDAWADRKKVFQAEDESFRPRGSAGEAGTHHGYSAEGWSWVVKLSYVLCTTWREVPPADVIAALPSPEQLESYVKYTDMNKHYFTSVFLLAALVCEKLEQPNDALLYAAKVLRYDPSKGSKDWRERTDDCRPTTHAQANSLRGRVLASLGKTEQAEAALEEAISISSKHGLWLFEMFALRDLKKCILDGDGRGDEGVGRLKAVMQNMKGPPSELTKLLGDGLNAEAILRS